MPLTEGDVEKYYSVPSTALSKGVKEGKVLKIVASNKLTNKTWEQFKPKTRNQRNTISFV